MVRSWSIPKRGGVGPWRVATLVTVTALASSTVATASRWSIEDVEARPSTRLGDLRLSPSGSPIVAFGGDGVYVARRSGSAYTIETVAASGCQHSMSMALDPSGEPAVAFVEATSALQLARSIGGGRYRVETIAWAAQDVGQGCSLAFAPNGEPAIVYKAAPPPLGDGAIMLARFDGARWGFLAVDSSPEARWGALAYDPSGAPTVAYYRPLAGLVVARFDGSSWVWQLVDNQVGYAVSLAHDAAGRPAVSYLVNGPQFDETRALFARFDGTSFVNEQLASSIDPNDLFITSSVAFDPGGDPLVAVGSYLGGERLFRKTGTTWSARSVPSSGGSPGALAVAGSGTAYVASAREGRYLEVGILDATSERSESVLESGLLGGFSSLALDPAGRPAVAYEDITAGGSDVRVARFDGAEWQRNGFPDARAPSLAFDLSGRPAFAVSEPLSTESLVLHRFDGAVWSSEVVDPAAWASTPSLAFDPAGRPAISYKDRNSDDLRLARWNGATWSIETVDSVGSVGDGSSLRFDAAGNPAISYRDWTTVKYARYDGQAWRIQVVAPAGWSITSLAFDAAGNPAFAYVDDTVANNVSFARFDGTRWTTETVEAYGKLGALAFDASGAPVLSYVVRPGRLRFARRTATAWLAEDVDVDVARDGWRTAMVLDAGGNPVIAYGSNPCSSDQRLARGLANGVLYRGTVSVLAPGWRTAALPLDASNDDSTPPFPLATGLPGMADDAAPTPAALGLYRALGPAGELLGKTLRAVKSGAGAGVSLRY